MTSSLSNRKFMAGLAGIGIMLVLAVPGLRVYPAGSAGTDPDNRYHADISGYAEPGIRCLCTGRRQC